MEVTSPVAMSRILLVMTTVTEEMVEAVGSGAQEVYSSDEEKGKAKGKEKGQGQGPGQEQERGPRLLRRPLAAGTQAGH